MEAEIVFDYKNKRIARAIAKAVSPDNFKTPESLKIKTGWKGGKVLTTVKSENGLHTFIATIDDLLFCTLTAEKTLQVARKLK